MDDVIIPYARIDQIKKFLMEIPKETCSLDELADKFGRSSLRNILPTLEILKLIEYDKKGKRISLSEIGRKVRVALITEDYEKAREILKSIVDDIELFRFVKGLLDRKGKLSSEEIGKELAFRYNKVWRNPATYRAYGSACASILGFVGYGIYERGILRKRGLTARKEKKLPSPYPSFGKILKILRELKSGEAELGELSRRLKTKKNRLGAELSVCVELGLVERLSPGKFILTTNGEKLIDPLNKPRQKEIWRKILLGSGYSRIIKLLLEKEVFDFEELGEILRHHFGGKWREQKTVNTFTKRFLNWLKEAEILEEVDGKYRLKLELVKGEFENEEQTAYGKESYTTRVVISTDYYLLGKSVGIAIASNDRNKIEDAVSFLVQFCKEVEEFAEVAELLEEHLKIFKELKLPDGRIFIPDINMLERRLGVQDEV